MPVNKPMVRIHVPAQPATQSGKGKSQGWVLEFAPRERHVLDPLTGWAGSGDTLRQLTIAFPSKEAAIAYAEANGYLYQVEEPPPAKPIKPKVYADNFRYGRTENWTH
jgi:hypothetical protein